MDWLCRFDRVNLHVQRVWNVFFFLFINFCHQKVLLCSWQYVKIHLVTNLSYVDLVFWMFQIYLSNGWPDTHLSRAWVWIWTWLWAAVSDMSTPAWAEWPWPSHCSRCPWQQLPPCCFQCCWPSGHMAQGQGQTSVKDKVKQCQEWRDSQTAKCVCRQDVVNVLSSSSAFFVVYCIVLKPNRSVGLLENLPVQNVCL